ncbi:MAG: RNA 3'-phosphate cyclase, partial [Nitrospirae bacterium]|nr:RNA 3'-phosphate cyclase [Nitrospirota bacterium]
MPVSYMTIDGSHGEGGGQILRSALSLAIILSKPVEIINIRRGRPKSGLQPQHLACVNACRDISDAHVEGDEIGSARLRFSPQVTKSGNFTFNVAEKRGSAGSTSLILQTLLPPLIFGQGPSRLTLMGGTHVPWSPSFHYLKEVFLPVIEKMGCSVRPTIDRWGWYPIGGGIIHAEINPLVRGTGLRGVRIEARGKLQRSRGISAVSNLPLSIAERQKKEGLNNLKTLGVDTDIEVLSAPSPGKGTFFFIVAEYEGIKAGFSALGAIGKPAEEVAQEACKAFLEYHDSNGTVEPHLADQLIPYMALADGP